VFWKLPRNRALICALRSWTILDFVGALAQKPFYIPFAELPSATLRCVNFVLNDNEIRGLEQNPETKSRWAQMARAGKKVMQFLSGGRYVANVVDGKVTLYGR
jgi:hypothetical protein